MLKAETKNAAEGQVARRFPSGLLHALVALPFPFSRSLALRALCLFLVVTESRSMAWTSIVSSSNGLLKAPAKKKVHRRGGGTTSVPVWYLRAGSLTLSFFSWWQSLALSDTLRSAS